MINLILHINGYFIKKIPLYFISLSESSKSSLDFRPTTVFFTTPSFTNKIEGIPFILKSCAMFECSSTFIFTKEIQMG